MLPPIKHKINSAVQNFPVIPPIANKPRPSRSQSQDAAASRSGDEEPPDGGDEDTKSRNRHLFKVYLVSLAQLAAVLLMVVAFTEVSAVRTFLHSHHWVGILATGIHGMIWPQLEDHLITYFAVSMLFLLCFWIILILCFPKVRDTPKYNIVIVIIFSLCEGLLLG